MPMPRATIVWSLTLGSHHICTLNVLDTAWSQLFSGVYVPTGLQDNPIWIAQDLDPDG